MEVCSVPLLSLVTDVTSCLENDGPLGENTAPSFMFRAISSQRILKYGLAPRKVRPAA